MKVVQYCFVAALFLILLSLPAFAVDAGNGTEEGTYPVLITVQLQALLDNTTTLEDIPRIALCINDPNQGEWSLASGKAILEPETPLNSTDQFRIASITKTFTAAAIMILAEDELLNLDDPISDYLPKFNIQNDINITIRMILSHRSGMRDHNNDIDYVKIIVYQDPLQVFTPQELVRASIDAGTNFPPGSDFKYCDTGYTVLALIIENVTGLPYSEFIQTRLIEPVGLNNTFVAYDAQIPSPHAHGYVDFEGNGTLQDWTYVHQ